MFIINLLINAYPGTLINFNCCRNPELLTFYNVNVCILERIVKYAHIDLLTEHFLTQMFLFHVVTGRIPTM